MALNPLFWLHLRITGSARMNLVIVLAYTGVLLLFTAGSYYIAASQDYPNITPATYARVDAAWLAVMTAAQCGFLLLIAPSAVRRAVQRDFDSGMIESHRLSPMSNLKIVLGYMSGAPIQAVLLYAVSLLFGGYFAVRYAGATGLGGMMGVRIALAGWYFSQGCIVVLAAMIGAFVLLIALATRGKGNVIGIVILIGVFGGWMAVFLVPGLALLAGVLSGSVLVGLLTSAKVGGDPSILIMGASLQLVFCIIFLAAACGKLRAPDRAIFSVELGLILLMVWGFTLIAGVFAAPAYGTLFPGWAEQSPTQLVASTGAFMLVALFPLIGAAIELFHRDRAAAFGEQKLVRRCTELALVPVWLGLMTATCWLVMTPQWAATQEPELAARGALVWRALLPIGIAMFLSFWVDFNWVYYLAAHGRRIFIGLPIMVVLLKAIPVLLDSAIRHFTWELTDLRWVAYGYLSGLSPIGTLIIAPEGGAAMWIGLLFQAALAVGATLLGLEE